MRNGLLVMAVAVLLVMPASVSAGALERVRSSLLGYDYLEEWQALDDEHLPPLFREPPLLEGRWVNGFRQKTTDAVVVFEFTDAVLSNNAAFCRSRVNAYLFFDSSRGDSKQFADPVYLGNYRELVSLAGSNDGENQCASIDHRELQEFTVVDGSIEDAGIERLLRASSQIAAGNSAACKVKPGSSVIEVGVTLTGMSGNTNAYYSFLGDDSGTAKVLWKLEQGSLLPARCEVNVVDQAHLAH